VSGESGDKKAHPILKKLVDKNAINHKIGNPPGNFARKALTG
jgi:hypothetical protein